MAAQSPRISAGKIVHEVIAVCEPLLESLGYECVHLEFRDGVLRFFIDQPDGITVTDCARASRQLEVVLDVEDSIAGKYTLEVSSPGLDRPLARLSDFARFEGQEATVKTRDPIGSRRRFTGTLEGVEDDAIVMAVDGDTVHIPLAGIKRANLKHAFDALEGS